jgi:hypothetical protein
MRGRLRGPAHSPSQRSCRSAPHERVLDVVTFEEEDESPFVGVLEVEPVEAG